jgi:hypothetical protein
MSNFIYLLLEYDLNINAPGAIYDFEPNGDKYKFTTGKTDYEVYFTKFFSSSKQYERSYKPVRKSFSAMTNEGVAKKVNLTVTAITLHFMENNKNWELISITPLTKKRADLVRILLDENVPKEKYNVEEDNTDKTVFLISKKYKKNNQ